MLNVAEISNKLSSMMFSFILLLKRVDFSGTSFNSTGSLKVHFLSNGKYIVPCNLPHLRNLTLKGEINT